MIGLVGLIDLVGAVGRRGAPVVLAISLAFTVAVADADDRMSGSAKEHMDRGLAEYKAQNYEGASIEFQAAYAIDPRREILFAWGQSERLRGDCARALTLYRQFLGLAPPPDEAKRAEGRIAECERTLEERRTSATTAPVTSSAAADTSSTTAVVPAPHAANEPAWYRDGLGATLIGVGVVSGAAGATLLVLSRRDITATDYGNFDAAATRADRQYVGGLVGTIAGGLLVGLGIARIVADGPSQASQASSVSVVLDRRGLAVAGRF